MPKTTKKRASWILIAVIAAAIAAAGWFWIWPSMQFISEKIVSIQEQRGEIDQLEQQKNLIIQDNISSYETKSQRLEESLITEENIIKLIEDLEKIATDAGVEYKLSVAGEAATDASRAVTAAPPDVKDPNQPESETNFIDLNLSMNGSFSQLFQVLKKIESLPSVINVAIMVIDKQVTFSSNPDDSEKPVTTSTISADYSLTIPLSK